MRKFSRIVLKKVRNRKNKNLSFKAVILGKKRLVGRHYNAGDSKVTVVNTKVLLKLLQFHNLEVSNKVGWLLVRGLYNNSKTANLNFMDKKNAVSKDQAKFSVYNQRI